MTVGVVYPESPAEQAGLRPGDQIFAIDGQNLDSLRPFYESIIIGQNDIVELTVQDARSSAGVRQLKLVLRGGQPTQMRMTRLEHVLDLPMNYFPLGFLLVGVAVLLLRPDDPNAWLLALFCGAFVRAAHCSKGYSDAPAGICCCLQDGHGVVVRSVFLLLLRSVSRTVAARPKASVAEIYLRCSRVNRDGSYGFPLSDRRRSLAALPWHSLARLGDIDLGSHGAGWIAGTGITRLAALRIPLFRRFSKRNHAGISITDL